MDLPFEFDNAASGRNTRIEYLYRDADNYKQIGVSVIAGRMSLDQAATVANRMQDGNLFIPGKVGLADLQLMMPTEWDDRVDDSFHEITSILPSDMDPTEGSLTVEAFVSAFEAVPEDWDAEAYVRDHLAPGA